MVENHRRKIKLQLGLQNAAPLNHLVYQSREKMQQMGRKKQRPLETEASYLAPEIQDALVQLVHAQDYARQVLENAGLLPAGTKNASPVVLRLTNGEAATRSAAVIPDWDSATRVLQVGGQVVKRYRVPSSTQELILAAFQEEGWPPRLDDPLPPLREGCSKDRLRDAIRHLNSNQKKRLIRFRGDGTGQGILWELVQGRAPTVAAAGKK
jgi:hypothetical protein